jgi:hypothetical protein
MPSSVCVQLIVLLLTLITYCPCDSTVILWQVEILLTALNCRRDGSRGKFRCRQRLSAHIREQGMQ